LVQRPDGDGRGAPFQPFNRLNIPDESVPVAVVTAAMPCRLPAASIDIKWLRFAELPGNESLVESRATDIETGYP
jgi:hypothetical protein